MMKGSKGLAAFLLILSITSGYLMSKASFIGKAGMSLFYRQYNFLKIWWQGALLMLVSLTVLFFLHGFIQKKLRVKQGKTLQRIGCVLALAGLYFTYYDFRHTLSHHLLGERFHIGVYLFWIGWIAISLYFLLTEKQQKIQQLPVRKETLDYKPVE